MHVQQHGDGAMSLSGSKLERLAYSVAEASVVTGLSRSSLYILMSDKRLTYTQVGKRRLIPAEALRRLVGSEAA